MSGTLGIVLFVVALLVAILIHEAAHFGVAKAFRIKVEEFFVGFGPRLWSFRRGETEYGVKAFPLGGYVRIAGMNPYEEISPEDYPRTYGAKPIWQRALVIVAGPATHFVIAFVLLAAYSGFFNQLTKTETVIAAVDKKLNGAQSPAAAVGLRTGDVVVRVDGIANPSEDELRSITRSHVGQPIRLVVRHGGVIRTLTVTPVKDQNLKVGRLGVGIAGQLAPGSSGFPGAFGNAAVAVGQYTAETVKSLGRVFGPEGVGRVVDLVFGNAQRQATDPVSIVGAGRAAGQVTQSVGFASLLVLLAVVNIFVGIVNLLPLPPFDGGHLAVLAVEKIRGRTVDMRKLVPLTAAVAAFLMIWFVSLTYLDIFKPIPNVFR